MGSDLVGRVNAMIKRAIVGVAAAAALTASAAYAQFVNMREISELNTVYGESHIVVSQDNLRCFFSTDRLDPIPRNMDIWYAERATLVDPFTIIGPVAELSTAKTDKAGFLSPDELTLYLARPTAFPVNWSLYVATRPTRFSPFSIPTMIVELDTGDELNATVSSDGLEMLFEDVGGNNHIMRSTRPTITSPWDSAQSVPELGVSQFQLKPTFYMDDLQLVFGCDMRSPNDIDICYTKRASTLDSWEPPIVLESISSPSFNDTPSAFVGSAPDRFLYFYTNRPVEFSLDDLWVVQIPCSGTILPDEVKTVYLVKDSVNPGKLKAYTSPQLDCMNAFNVYENDFGSYTSTNQLSCGNVAAAAITYVTFSITPTKATQYYIMTGSNKIGEGPAGTIPTPQSCGAY